MSPSVFCELLESLDWMAANVAMTAQNNVPAEHIHTNNLFADTDRNSTLSWSKEDYVWNPEEHPTLHMSMQALQKACSAFKKRTTMIKVSTDMAGCFKRQT